MTRVFDPINAGSSEIEDWLRHALTEYQKTQSRWSLSPISLLIGDRDDLAHDLHRYIETLSSASKKRWNKAILRLILDRSIQDEDILITLVDLAVLSRSSDLLKLLPDLAREKYAKEPLLYRIINAVLELPTTDAVSRECIEAVASNVSFPERSANTSFLTLCCIAPDDWIEHARLVSEKIPKPSNPKDKDWSYLHDCAESVLLTIGLERLGAHWHEFVNDSGLNWLRDSFLTGEAPLVSAEKNKLTSNLFPGREIESNPKVLIV